VQHGRVGHLHRHREADRLGRGAGRLAAADLHADVVDAVRRQQLGAGLGGQPLGQPVSGCEPVGDPRPGERGPDAHAHGRLVGRDPPPRGVPHRPGEGTHGRLHGAVHGDPVGPGPCRRVRGDQQHGDVGSGPGPCHGGGQLAGLGQAVGDEHHEDGVHLPGVEQRHQGGCQIIGGQIAAQVHRVPGADRAGRRLAEEGLEP
jgi:hypothetical protein